MLLTKLLSSLYSFSGITNDSIFYFRHRLFNYIFPFFILQIIDKFILHTLTDNKQHEFAILKKKNISFFVGSFVGSS